MCAIIKANMSLYTFDELFEKLRSADESLEIEAKRATEDSVKLFL